MNMENTYYPLSETQLGFYYTWLKKTDTTEYNVPYIYHLSKDIDADRLEEALKKTFSLFPIYSSHIIVDDGKVCIFPDPERKITIERITATDDGLAHVVREFVRPFDIYNEPLVHVAIVETESTLIMLLDNFHAVSDGNTLLMFHWVLRDIYAGIEVKPEDTTYFDYILSEKESFATDAYQKSKDHYKDMFSGVTMTKTRLQLAGEYGSLKSVSEFISADIVNDFCKANSVTPNLLMMAAYSYTLSIFSREKKVAFYTVNHGRTERRFRKSMGPFIKSAPVCVEIRNDETILDFISSMKREMMGTIRHGIYPFSHFCQDLGMHPETSFVYQSGLEEKLELDGHNFIIEALPLGKVSSNMNMVVFENRGEFDLRLCYNDAKHTQFEMQQFVHCMCNVVNFMISDSEKCIVNINVVSDAEKNIMLELSKGEKRKTEFSTFLRMFYKCVEQYPNNIAVVDEFGSITYKELDYQSNILASRLIKRGVKKGDFVAINLNRTKEWVIGIISIFKAGAAYLPLANDFPKERLDYIIDDSKAKFVIDKKYFLENKNIYSDILPMVDKEDNAYMIYTSGSTGQPKGVVVQHKALSSFCSSCIDIFELQETSSFICHFSFGFDASLFAICPILCCGGTLHILNKDILLEPALVSQYIESHHITHASFTTRFGVELLEHYELPLKLVALGGERLDVLPNSKVKLFNVYGPTEFTIISTYAEVENIDNYSAIPIGRPMPNSCAYVLDDNLHLLPKGCVGELYLAGPQIAKGYWNRPELTSERFINNPFASSDDYDVMYKTGDLVWWNEDGELVYTDRVDRQVKLSGFRIEIGEIEACLSQCEGVTQAVVDLKEVNGRKTICAYYTASNKLDSGKIKELLAQKLPDYMVPSFIIYMEEFPYNHSCKVDMKRLPIPETVIDSHYVAAETVDEKVVTAIVEKVLQLKNIGVTYNLMNLGLTSMQAMKIAVEAEFMGVNVSVSSIFENPTIRGFLSTPQRLYFWANDYDPAKPVLVLFCGYMYCHPFYDEFIKKFSDRYSVFVMEGFVEYFLWKRKVDFEVLIDFYEQITRTVLEGVNVHAVTGHCMGAEIAMHYAQRLIDKGISRPRLLMVEGAVDRPTQEVTEMDKTNLEAEHKRIKNHIINSRPHIKFTGDMILCMASKITRKLEYNGPDITDEELFTKEYNEYFGNRKKWRELYPDAPYFEVDADHWTIFSGDALNAISDIVDKFR